MSKQTSTFQENYSGVVIARMFGNDDKRVAEFHEDYKNACLHRPQLNVTDKDRSLAIEFKRGALMSELMRKHKMSYGQVSAAINRAAREKFLQQK